MSKVIHRITGLSKVGGDRGAHFFGKNLDKTIFAKIMKEHNVIKGMRDYNYVDSQDQSL